MPLFGSGPKPPQQWQSHNDALQYHRAKYEEGIRSGQFEPFLYPWGTLGALIVVLYLLVPHQNRPWLRKARFLVFAWIVGFAAYSIRYTRARTMAPSLGLGLISAWSVIWIMAILVMNDAQTDFQRIERSEGLFKRTILEEAPKRTIQSTQNGSTPVTGNTTQGNGHIQQHEHLGPRSRHGTFAWQPYPLTPFIERLDWVIDVFCNFRGVGWNWRTSSQPPPPKWVQEQLQRSTHRPPKQSLRTHPYQPQTYTTRETLTTASLKTLLIGYITLDALKTAMNHDPYFWGLVDRLPPSTPSPPTLNPLPHFLAFLSAHPTLLRTFHLFLTQHAIHHALQTIFSLSPLIFSTLLGPTLIGARASPWMYPSTWGPYSSVLDRGLSGWWSSWWHQTFRYAFEAPSRKIIALLRLHPRSPAARLLQVFIAFGLSGVLHACGTYTSNGGFTKPRNALLFFILQAVGVVGEMLGMLLLKKLPFYGRVPRVVIRGLTFVYVHVWFYYTGPLLADDFARSGVWLFEPIPISIFRGLGLGVKGDGWWCWSGEWVRWVSGKSWWKTGLSI